MQIKCFYCDAPITSHLEETTIFRGVAECPECVDGEAFESAKPVIFYAKMISENYMEFQQAQTKGDKEAMLRLMRQGAEFFERLNQALQKMRAQEIQ